MAIRYGRLNSIVTSPCGLKVSRRSFEECKSSLAAHLVSCYLCQGKLISQYIKRIFDPSEA